MTLAEKLEAYSMPEPNSGCQLWLGGHARGYGTMRWEGRHQRAHRLAWQVMHGSIPAGLVLCHRCDVPSCINPAHLFLGTQADNIADMHAKGRNRQGAARRLPAADERAIYSDRRPLLVIAEQYGIHPKTIRKIRLRLTPPQGGMRDEGRRG